MKIFSSSQIYAADEFTIKKQQITSEALMERAAKEIFRWLHGRLQGAPLKIHIFCGIGNNGGDGIALARHLQEHGYHIEVNVVNYSEKRSKDFLINMDRLKARKIWPNFLNEESALPEIGPDDIIVDAIFGIGLNRSPADWVVTVIQHLMASGAFILSVDVPSGLFLERAVEDRRAVVKADHVLSFQAPKLIFFLPETARFIRQWEVLDIGLDREYLHSTETVFELVGPSEVLPYYKPRQKFAHKGTFGHSLILGGSKGKIGAIILASRACLKAGSGLVTAYLPECGYAPLQTAVPEAMVITDRETDEIAEINFKMDPDVIGLGMGLGTSVKSVEALEAFLKKNVTPLVIDADGLNILAKKKTLLDALPPNSVLTPHPKELERLMGPWKDDFDKLEKALDFSEKYNCVLVLKGAHTITFFKGKGYINVSGNPGMATAGTGDVLTGVITGLIAQGYKPLEAAIFGVYLHGRAGDLGAGQNGFEALTAGVLIDFLGPAYLELLRPPEAPKKPDEETDEN